MMQRKQEIFNIQSLLDKGIIKRNEINGEISFDLQTLKEQDLGGYELFSQSPLEVFNNIKKDYNNIFPSFFKKINLVGVENLNEISKLRVTEINSLVRISGMITRTTKVIAVVDSRVFECNNCGTLITIQGSDYPKRCTCGKVGHFTIKEEGLIDLQEIEIEELQESLSDRQPRQIRVRLLNELCDYNISNRLQPGNKVEIIGNTEKLKIEKKTKLREDLFEYRINALDVRHLDDKYQEDLITEEDRKQILEISFVNPLDTLAKSLSPTIYGHDLIKKALVLQMIGGVTKRKDKGMNTRGRINILICGEPGSGKTMIGRSLVKRMPRSYFVSGDEATKVGLTFIVERDPLLNNQWSLKGGALCRCEDSILCIDELDKLDPENLKALHTPMELGEIPVDKADIHTTLRANCSILAIANPVGGLFDDDPNNTITKQLNLPPALLSRFDLIFIMKDVIDKDVDSAIAEKIFNNKIDSDVIDPELFRKYITLAKNRSPERSPDILEDLKKFYHGIREKSISPNSKTRGMPITTRHFEGLLRLAEAHAKLRFSGKVEQQDLDVAKNLFLETLGKLGIDNETGLWDQSIISQKVPVSKRGKLEEVLGIIDHLQNQIGGSVSFFDIQKQAEGKNISRIDLNRFLEQLLKEVEIFKKIRYRDISEEELAKWIKNKKSK